MPMADIFDVVSSGDIGSGMNSDAWNKWASSFKDGVPTDWLKNVDLGGLLSAGAGAGIGALMGGGSSQKPTGYQGTVPVYTAVRQQVPMVDEPGRRPGSGGRQYFTNTQFLPRTDTAGITAAMNAAGLQSDAIRQANIAPTQGARTAALNEAQSLFMPYRPSEGVPSPYGTPAPAETAPATNETTNNNTPELIIQENTNWAAGEGGAKGGLVDILRMAKGGSTGYYLGGQTDGMADKIPATIANKQPAKLSHGEFVIPSDCVSALGSGNSEAGAKVLYDMMDRIRKHAHGTTKQIKPANLKKTLPA